MHRKEGQPLAALLFCPPMVTTLFALILVFLLSVSPAVGESGDPGDRPDTPSAVTPPPDACRDCGLQYYPPAATPPEAPAPAASNSPSKTASDVPVSAVPGRSHLSSDPRIRTARVLVQRNRFAQALAILRPLVPDHQDQTDVQFLLGLAANAVVTGTRCRRGETARATGRGHRGVPVHSDPPAGPGARAPGTRPGLLSQGGGCLGPWPF